MTVKETRGQTRDQASRREQILALVRTHDFVRINDLSDRLGVSIVTIRHDLDELASRGRIRRIRGGAIPRVPPYSERPYEAREDAQAQEKALIARAAVGIISANDSIIIDVGTTSMAVAHELVARTDLEGLTVFTSGMNIALALELAIPRIHVVVTGGTLRPLQHSLVEPMAGLMFDEIRASVAFVAANGVHPERGITTTNLPEAAMKQRMLAASHRRVVIVDATKFSQEALVRVADLNDIDLIITAGNIDEALLANVREKVQVHLATSEGEPVAAPTATATGEVVEFDASSSQDARPGSNGSPAIRG